ncbi:hypothetical protein QBG86_003878 [Salmonella enterica]|nr:hypothetical protein [Salmonella enterica]EKS2298072.1 hypothetical protein [Salmonella enterica]EKS2420446.1 hypothetical protein [Salmonella enterica]
MINYNLTLKEKALAAAEFLRTHARHAESSPYLVDRIGAEPRMMAANAIEQLVKENDELRAQLVAFQKAASPAVAVDPAKEDSEHTCYTSFTKGACVRLKWHPYQRGIVRDNRLDDRRGYLIFVCFESEFEENRWVKARNLELVPDK